LSKKGKEILIKAVAQAIPTYAMSCFDLTKTLCEEISAMICRYWWSQQDEKNRCHWISWEQMTKSKQEGGMGFRDLHIFNLAMLARQSWRLLQNPDSLCGTVLKALYFPDCSLLEAKPVPTMSYTRRSILKGRDLLKEGIIWRVGSGETIDVWRDPWIPGGTTRRLRTPMPNLRDDDVLNVSDLIDPVTEQWDVGILHTMFEPADVKSILSIPIKRGMEDLIAWNFDNKGIFSVRSAYRLGVSLRDCIANKDASTSSAVSLISPSWQRIWSLNLPGKVQIFAWRLAHNSLPTRMNISRKKVDLDTRCPMCKRLDEDGGHLFIKCKKVKEIWRDFSLEEIRLKLQEANNAMQMFDIIWTLPTEQQQMVVILLWDWWTVRNKLNAGEREKPATEVCSLIQRHYLDFCVHLATPSVREVENKTLPSKSSLWKRPAIGNVKINFDAAYHKDSGDGGWGFVARSDTGDFIAAGAGRLKYLRSALQAEAEACMAAIEGAEALGLHRVEFESDCKVLVSALKEHTHDFAEIGVLMREARSNCTQAFNLFNFIFCRRECNKVAHSLAQFGYSAEVECSGWTDEVPPFISDVVSSDLAVHQG
jgi:ribonuclease HI